MFEEEADHAETVMLVKANLGKPRNYKDGFKDGAEFGYNKAKEEMENLIEELASSLSVVGECGKEECELIDKAQKFINKPIF